MTALSGLARRLLLYGLLLELGALSLAWNFVACILRLVMPRHRGTALGRLAIARTYRFYWSTAEALGMMRIEADALDALDAEPGGLIVAANHPTMLDAMVLVAHLPRSVCIMKAELMRNVFLSAGARLARYIRNDSPRGLVRAAVECLREGGQLVMFPEGTRTVRAPVNRFRPGIAMIAETARVPVQTVFIETESPYLRKGWPIWRAPRFPIVVRARLGPRFTPTGDRQLLLEQLERCFGDALAPAAPRRETRETVDAL